MPTSSRLLTTTAQRRLERVLAVCLAVGFVVQSSIQFTPTAIAQTNDSATFVEDESNDGLVSADAAAGQSAVAAPAEPIIAADTGWLNPSSNSMLAAIVTNPANAYAEDSTDAVFDSSSSAQYGTFGLALPSGALVTGLEVKTRAHSVSGSDERNLNVSVSWNDGVNWSDSVDTTDTDADYVTDTLGGPTDTWGHSWSLGQLADGQFAVRVRDDFSSGTAGLDHVAVKVHYTTIEPNPTLPRACGLDLALVIDSSGSISTSELTQMKNAYRAFVDAFLPGTPTHMSVVEYDTNVVLPTLGFTNDITNIKDDIDAAVSGGWTNWEAGLLASHNTYDPRPAKPDLMLFASDGNPNTTGVDGDADGGAAGEAAARAAAVTRANAIKADGIRILALGIGDNLNLANLQAISGPNVNTGLTSDVITTSFDTLAADLAELANVLCGGKILVQKALDTNGDGQADLDGSVADPLLAGWTFDVDGSPSDPSAQTTDSTGSLEFDVLNGTYSLSETALRPNTGLVTAECRKGPDSVGSFDPQTRTVSGLTLTTDETVACTFLNQTAAGTLRVIKQVSGGSAEPADWNIHVLEQGTDVSGSPQPGSLPGTDYELTPGAYQVTETDGPSGYALTYSGDCDRQGSVTVAAGQTATCTLTNTRATGDLEVCKVADVNGDGLLGGDPLYTAGWPMTLDPGTDHPVQQSTSDNGCTTFADLRPGQHRVQEGSLEGWIRTFPSGSDVQTLEVIPDQTVRAVFGNTQLGSIHGFKWNDRNGNGRRDCSDDDHATASTTDHRECEPLLGGWSIQLWQGHTLIASTETMSDDEGFGWYWFQNLRPGTYQVCEVGQAGWSQTHPDGCHTIELESGETESPWSFGNQPGLSTISGHKYYDWDHSGDLTQGDTPLGDWTIKLWDGDSLLDQTTTAPDGSYALPVANGLEPGWYNVCEELPADWFTANDLCQGVYVNGKDNVTDRDFFNYRNAYQVSGFKFHDRNGNGVWDCSDEPALEGEGRCEPPLPDWTISLWAADTLIASTTTDGDGEYAFQNLEPGRYRVCEVQLDGWRRTWPAEADCQTVDLPPEKGDTSFANFGNQRLGSVRGTKWEDGDGNGRRDCDEEDLFNRPRTLTEECESGLEGWTIQLKQGQSVIASATTDSNGDYRFTEVIPGAYTVCEVQQPGWAQTFPAENQCHAIVVSGDGSESSWNFGNVRLGAIAGHKFEQTGPEQRQGLAGFPLTLDQWNGESWTASLQTATGPDGTYHFEGLRPGRYRVCESIPVTVGFGWKQLSPTEPECYAEDIQSGTMITDRDFVNQRLLADLTVTKTDGLTTASVGQQLTYTIVVSNTGAWTADSVSVSDTLPPQATYVSSALNGVTALAVVTPNATGDTLAWSSLSSLAPGGSLTLTVTVALDTVFAFGSTTLTNTVQVQTTSVESSTANNSATDTTAVSAAPTLALQKTAPGTVPAGQTIRYTVAWSVAGTSAATNVALTDPLPANTSFVSVEDGGTYDATAKTVTWLLGTQAPGASGQVHFTVRAASPVANGAVVTNVASLDSVETDPVVASATVTITSAPALSLTKTENVDTFLNPGQSFVYTLVVANAASATDTAHAVTVTDTLPADLTYEDGTTTKTYGPFELAPGASQTITVSAVVAASTAAGTFTNTATAKGSNTDQVTARATIEVRVPVVLATPELTIVKTALRTAANRGQTVRYTVEVTNRGASEAVNVTVADQLPADFTFAADGATSKTFTIGTLQPGQTFLLSYDVKVGRRAKAGNHRNVATAEADNAAPVSDDATIRVRTVKVLAATGAGAFDRLLLVFGLTLLAAGLAAVSHVRRRLTA